MALGLSFGKNKQKVDLTRTTDSTQTQTQNSTTNQQQTQATTSQSNAASQAASQSSGRTQQSGTGSSQTAGTQVQTGRVQTFSDQVLSALEAAGLDSIGRASAGGRVNTSSLDGFNMGDFVNDAVTQASVAASRQRGISEGGMADSLGGTSRGNTMAALLSQQLALEEAGAVAGARSQATAQGMDILRQNIGTNIAASGQDQDFMTRILGALQGGQQTSTGEMITSQNQTNQTQQIGSEQSNQQQNQTSQQNQQQMSELISAIAQLVSGTSRTTGTETEKGTTTKAGGGVGLSL